MTRIVPAILVKTKAEYLSKLSLAKQLTNRFQVDIIDGQYVDNQTIGLGDLTRLIESRVDIHLMVAEPKLFVEQAITLNPNLIIIQFECGQDITPQLERIKKSGLQAGVAINPGTELAKLEPLKELMNHILLMGYPAGFSGQKFQNQVLERVAIVRDLFPYAELGLDGGVTKDNAKRILRAGFDVVNINSAIFEADDPLNMYSQLLEYTL